MLSQQFSNAVVGWLHTVFWRRDFEVVQIKTKITDLLFQLCGRFCCQFSMSDLTSKRDEIVQLLQQLKRQTHSGAQVCLDVRVLPVVLVELVTSGDAMRI